jgi:hypothetical protein
VIRFAEIQARVDRTTSIGERHLGHLCALLVWHEEDLVDDAERRRNDVIFAWQGNRNPSTILSGCRAYGAIGG